MPLYMDLHHIDPNITQEDLDKAHYRDIEVQGKYGLKHKKYYVNFEEKTVFCLVDAPNEQSLHDGHAEVHGVGPCNVIEVSSLTPTYNFDNMLGEQGGKNQWDVALTRTGEIDTGFRTLMLVSFADLTGQNNYLKHEVYRLMKQNDGQTVQQPDSKIMASFLHAHDAIFCARAIGSYLNAHSNQIEFIVGVVTGRPVDETGSILFEETMRQLRSLSLLGKSTGIYVDMKTKQLFEKGLNETPYDWQGISSFISDTDFARLGTLCDLLDANRSNSNFRSKGLSDALGLSKAQAYRKIKALTGMSPNELIREMRLRLAFDKLAHSSKTVAEIAYAHGFNSPTYFTRVFKERFGILPTGYNKVNP